MNGIILGCKRLDMIEPYLNKNQIKYTCIELNEEHSVASSLNNKIKYLKENDYINEVINILQKRSIDFILSNASTDYQAILNSQIGTEAHNLYNVLFLGHSVETTLLFSNKYETKLLLEKNNILTPKYTYCSSKKQLLRECEEIGFPLIVKSLYGCAGKDQCIARNNIELENFVNTCKESDYIIEKFLDGLEVSIEVFKSKSSFLYLPPIYKSYTSLNGLHSLEKVRIFPYSFDHNLLEKAKMISEKIATLIPINGWLDIDAILVGEKLYVIEVNPRFSGVSRLIGMAMNVNPYEIMLQTYLENAMNFNDNLSGVSIEVPISNDFPSDNANNIYCSIRPHAKNSKGFITVSSKNFELLREKLIQIGQQNINLSRDIKYGLNIIDRLNNVGSYELNEKYEC